eukprot:CAMPEP_0204612262 /NCGR_PEP_ID=MMETSP0717-20131115/345_1 /ASSEMBLY_ACC=CAM_ASM_000666 /TAXON_ID=230516 /ORGANISM="Chaetoceros curvisetus" /LENGTH=627 /DNA_ID=CAMNT_0051624273 /DNA_START=77 /DNA_END=1960 /DNA_ORIENTATION=-
MKYLNIKLLSFPLFVGHRRWHGEAFSVTNPNPLRRSPIATSDRKSASPNKIQQKFPCPHALSSHTSDKNDVMEDPKLNKWVKSVLDLNNDGKVDAKDLDILLSRIEQKLDLNRDKWKAILDLNNDGKVDAEDLKVLITKLQKSCFDVNGDGKIDIEDAKAALCILALTSAVFSSPLPAHAKGGGGRSGGGSRGSASSSRSTGGGGSHGSSSSSSHRSSYSHNTVYVSDDDHDYPRWTRPNHHGFPNLDPRMCFDLPENGEVINVLRNEYTGQYAPATVTDVNDGFWCSFTALPLDNQRPESHNSFKNHWFYDALGIVILRGELSVLLEECNRVLDEVIFDADFNKLPIPTNEPPPLKRGKFKGKSKELDRGKLIEQDVATDLVFGEDGSILGSGIDSADGDYMVAGSWRKCGSEYLLRWKEVYEGFNVKVQGKAITLESGKVVMIRGYFRSSLGIKGRFNIQNMRARKPRVTSFAPIYEVAGVKTLQEVTFENKFRKLPEPSILTSPPCSGRFIGKAIEKDGSRLISQNVATDLVFKRDGHISGSGSDSIDGEYTVVGRWKKSEGGYKLSWKEVYNGFDVQVQGDMKDTENLTDEDVQILGAFRSSLKIRGTFDIKLGDTDHSDGFE